ncbi:MAG: 23S rRNA (guanosine(2251)-2'-O)-methyltransferase RlmB [Lachnospiraceae bacterium]|nr:23S rRNA (guanosine(2251)-2'-O)-methyltransferase RlmB [Lachnospiraceae bacterium]
MESNNTKKTNKEKQYELMVEGRNPVTEALKTNDNIDKLYVQEGVHNGPLVTIIAMAKKKGILVVSVPKEKLDAMSETGHHQGVILNLSAVKYAEVDDILKKAEEKNEKPFVFILDGIEDPHNLGAIIRSANLAGAHGVIIPKHRAATVNATVAKASAGAVYHTLLAKVTNIAQTIDYLKEKGLWFACADMDGIPMYDANLTGAIGIVIGNEGKGVSRIVKEKCDFTVSIPMKGDIDSLNASVAAGILAWEVVRQNRK